jgi:hypothetical protein
MKTTLTASGGRLANNYVTFAKPARHVDNIFLILNLGDEQLRYILDEGVGAGV